MKMKYYTKISNIIIILSMICLIVIESIQWKEDSLLIILLASVIVIRDLTDFIKLNFTIEISNKEDE